MSDWKVKAGSAFQILDNYRYQIVGTLVVAVLAWIISLIGLWQLYIIAGMIGGLVVGKEKNYQGSVIGAAGLIIGASVYLNVKLITAIDVWNQFSELLTGINMSVLSFLLPLLFLALLGAVSGYTGALLLPILIMLTEKSKELQKEPVKK
ncbi:MAG: hypothetical protein ACFFD4_27315 [Candidatus Odinarchaeota archaeon]